MPRTTEPQPSVDLLTSEVAAELDLDRSTLSRWVKDGRISPSRKLPGRTGPFLFSAAEVQRVKRELAVERRRRTRASARQAEAASR